MPEEAQVRLVPELENIRREIEAINREFTGLCEGLSANQLSWRSQADEWSIAEILLHLQLTVEKILPGLDGAIAKARRQELFSDGPFQLGMMGKFFVWYVKPPPVIKLPAPKSLKPFPAGSAEASLPGFLAAQQLMADKLSELNGIDLSRSKFVSPFTSFVRMNLLALLQVFTNHERRHLYQAKNVRNGFIRETGTPPE